MLMITQILILLLGAGSFNVATTATHVTNPTTLNGDLIAESYTQSISVDPTTGYAPGPGRIMIDREVIEYTSLTAATFEGCRRGVAGTTATTHASGTRVGQKQCLITSTGTISTNPRCKCSKTGLNSYRASEWMVGWSSSTAPNKSSK